MLFRSTVLQLKSEHEIAVLEMGISDFGEMHRLSEIARPDICILTNIGQCHLEFLGDRDGVLKAKTEIFDFMNPEGTIFVNGDDDKLITLKDICMMILLSEKIIVLRVSPTLVVFGIRPVQVINTAII